MPPISPRCSARAWNIETIGTLLDAEPPVAEADGCDAQGLEDRANVSGATPLILAAEENRVAVAELLIAHGADVSIADRDGYTALTQAWAKMRTEMVRLLKRHGATCQPVEILGTDDYYHRCVAAGQ